MCSFNAGSSGLIPDAAIFGMKYLHHGTVMYLPYVRFMASTFPGPRALSVRLPGVRGYYTALRQFTPVALDSVLHTYFANV